MDAHSCELADTQLTPPKSEELYVENNVGQRQGGTWRRSGIPIANVLLRAKLTGVAWLMVLPLLMLASLPANVRAAATPLVAYLKHGNVFFVPVGGGGTTAVTTRGSADPNSVSYPWYQWSPSGRYLLLVRQQESYDLLLINRQGDLVRTLLHNMGQATFYPSWAIDADEGVS